MNYPEPIHVVATTSTNTTLDELCNHQQLPELSCVYTDYQSAGRGQRGNSWESEDGCNLLFSVVFFPEFLPANKQFYLSQVNALALQETLSQYTDDITVKWPNDIYWKDMKLCGTLIENDLTGMNLSRSIAGTGVNLNQKRFVSNAPNPVSLSQITGKHYTIQTILHQILDRTAFYYEWLRQGKGEEIADRYCKVLYRKEGLHTYRDANGLFQAQIIEIQPTGRLILEDEAGLIRPYLFKEVACVLPSPQGNTLEL